MALHPTHQHNFWPHHTLQHLHPHKLHSCNDAKSWTIYIPTGWNYFIRLIQAVIGTVAFLIFSDTLTRKAAKLIIGAFFSFGFFWANRRTLVGFVYTVWFSITFQISIDTGPIVANESKWRTPRIHQVRKLFFRISANAEIFSPKTLWGVYLVLKRRFTRYLHYTRTSWICSRSENVHKFPLLMKKNQNNFYFIKKFG